MHEIALLQEAEKREVDSKKNPQKTAGWARRVACKQEKRTKERMTEATIQVYPQSMFPLLQYRKNSVYSESDWSSSEIALTLALSMSRMVSVSNTASGPKFSY